jgi:hypothetical protein
LCHHSFDLFTKRFDVFWVGKKAIQYLRECLCAGDGLAKTVVNEEILLLAREVE